jgi:hypothetical protein
VKVALVRPAMLYFVAALPVLVIVNVALPVADAGSIGSENVTANVSPALTAPSLLPVATLTTDGFVES